MAYCSSALDARDNVKDKLRGILRKEGIPGDVVVLTGSDGIMMKGWLVDLFSGKIASEICDVAIVVGTSAVNCGISSSSLYYVCWKGFPRTFIEFVQLLGRLKRNNSRSMQDTIHIVLSLRYFSSTFAAIFKQENINEQRRQLHEFRQVTRIMMSRDKCMREAVECYYGSGILRLPLTCDKLCPTCRGEKAKTVNRSFLVDHLEAEVFADGSVTLGKLCVKLLERKGSVWVAKCTDIKTIDAHELVVLLWVHHIITVFDEKGGSTDGKTKLKSNIHCCFEKKPTGSSIRMNHRDESCWLHIPYV